MIQMKPAFAVLNDRLVVGFVGLVTVHLP